MDTENTKLFSDIIKKAEVENFLEILPKNIRQLVVSLGKLSEVQTRTESDFSTRYYLFDGQKQIATLFQDRATCSMGVSPVYLWILKEK